MSAFRADMTVKDAQALMRKLVRDGHECPVCTQFAKVYRRPLHASMARGLVLMYRSARRDWCDITADADRRGGDLAKCRYWGLIEADERTRDDGSSRTGWWRVTRLGEEFVRDRATVRSHALVYDGRCLRLDGGLVTIREALGRRFDYDELMSA